MNSQPSEKEMKAFRDGITEDFSPMINGDIEQIMAKYSDGHQIPTMQMLFFHFAFRASYYKLRLKMSGFSDAKVAGTQKIAEQNARQVLGAERGQPILYGDN